ncbi:MAG: bifunctional demethylmenaquinone methyltransferase/2-methoxy-6-polyprenyl-1,4-benzoquinol methylase UbiE [Bacteroidetes bacterium]|nr:bifunctional demethylmenaquinone methyltransferase/2-methoxy-6-polyprenyl-1,4-benzoquinol methylase UbiE [Bacteroidota bacterium]
MNSIPPKQELIRQLFDDISPTYDFLNHLLSAGIDRSWRKKTIRMLEKKTLFSILDMATGTADLAVEAAMSFPGAKVTGIDISEKMIEIARKKVIKAGLDGRIRVETADGENLPFPGESFDAVTIAFGIRNFESVTCGLNEIFRVLKKNGMLVVLEFSNPKSTLLRKMYWLYFTGVLPFIGKIISGNRSAYSYLPESVKEFPSGEEFLRLLVQSGFTETSCTPLSCGIASIYKGVK